MSEQFESFITQLIETNATLNFFTDFKKIKSNISKISIKLNQLNYLIGKDNLKLAIEELFKENPKVFEVLGILIALREKNRKILNKEGKIVELDTYFKTPERIYEFIEDSGLGDIFRDKDINNLVDYVFGIEVGLDTNARKNRSGKNMSKTVSSIFDREKIFYRREVNITDFPEITSLGVDLKRFDFVIKTEVKTYFIETNFYNGGGSKLNEVARAYSDIASKINKYKNFEFVWITDGRGWKSAENKLKEAFSIIPSVYNLTNLNIFIKKLLEEKVVSF